MPVRPVLLVGTVLLLAAALPAGAIGTEDANDCPTAPGDFCERSGSCSIQGADWYQYVTIDKSGKFDTQGWPGLCDMVHVALVQGNCSPAQSQTDVTAWLSATSHAAIPAISGPLVCNADIVADGDLAPWDAPDGRIDAADVSIATRLALGQLSPGDLQLEHGDIDGDGGIDLADLLQITQAAFTQ